MNQKGKSNGKKPPVIFVKTTERFKQKVKCAADVLEHDVSRFTRDALAEKLDRLSAENKAVARALRAFAA